MGDLRFYRRSRTWETTRHSYCQWLGDIDIPDERFAISGGLQAWRPFDAQSNVWILYFRMILKGNKLFVMRKSMGSARQKTLTFADPVRNATSAPVARKSLVKLPVWVHRSFAFCLGICGSLAILALIATAMLTRSRSRLKRLTD
jgi:hypothetical protein